MSEKAKEYGAPTKSKDFEGRGGATERVDFGGSAAEGAERSQRRRVPKFRFESEAEKLQKSKLHMEKRGEELERAREKLSVQKPVKPPGPVKRITNVAKTETWAFVHGKIHQVEDENVGVEGAHKAELFSESALRTGNYHVKKAIRTSPEKKAFRAERREVKARADYQYRTAKQEHPELKRNPVQQYWQHMRMRTNTEGSVVKKATAFIKRRSSSKVVLILMFSLLLVLQSCVASVMTLGNGLVGSIGASSYQPDEAELRAAEAYYCSMEDKLRQYLDDYELTHDYEEYSYDLDEINHDPYVLISMLCSIYEGPWTLDDVKGTLGQIFEKQYILTETVTSVHTDDEEEYERCRVELENKHLDRLPIEILSQEQLETYSVYMATLGNRPDLFPGSAYVNLYTGPLTMHEIPEAYFDDERFAAIMEEAEKYIGYPYVWGGSSPATSFDCSGYVSYVLNQSGWNVGRLTAQGLYNICTPTDSPNPGDLVFFIGTYDTPEISHVGIYVGDGWMLHCGDPIQYADLSLNYWQQHFYAYGRLP